MQSQHSFKLVPQEVWQEGEDTIQAKVLWDDGDPASNIALFGLQASRWHLISKPSPLMVRLGKKKMNNLFRDGAIDGDDVAKLDRVLFPIAFILNSSYLTCRAIEGPVRGCESVSEGYLHFPPASLLSPSLLQSSQMLSTCSGKKLATALADVKPVLVGTALACGPLDSAWVQVLRPNIPQVLDLMAFQHPSTGALKADPTIWVCCGVGMKQTLGTSTEKGSAVVTCVWAGVQDLWKRLRGADNGSLPIWTQVWPIPTIPAQP
jgi:hypothetical protein